MNFEQLKWAFADALRRNEHAVAVRILDQFTEQATELDLARALSLRAGFIMLHDQRQSSEGLYLIEEALTLSKEDPELQMESAIRGLALCYVMGDVHRAMRYELLGNQLLRDHGNSPICLYPWAFYSNLAHIASLRNENAQTFWHLVQATRLLLQTSEEAAPNRQCLLFGFHLRIAEVCLEMGRTPEAEDALENAHKLVTDQDDELALKVATARCLLTRGQSEQSRQLLEMVTSQAPESWPPLYRVQLELAHSLVSKQVGDVRGFNHYITKAHTTATRYGLDHMLCRIQRVMRTPEQLEAVQ